MSEVRGGGVHEVPEAGTASSAIEIVEVAEVAISAPHFAVDQGLVPSSLRVGIVKEPSKRIDLEQVGGDRRGSGWAGGDKGGWKVTSVKPAGQGIRWDRGAVRFR